MRLLIVLFVLCAVLGRSNGSTAKPPYASTTALLNNRPTYVSNTVASLNNPPTYYSNINTASLNNRPTYAFNITTDSQYNYTTSPSWNNRTTSPPKSKKTEIHYHYSPPQALTYWGKSYPVYQGQPPDYVYEYRNSGSRFDNLLAGLALYNLGRNSHYHHHIYPKRYVPISGEICKLGIRKQSGEYVETRIDCDLMSSFIWEDPMNVAWNGQRFGMTSNFVEDALKVKGPSIEVTPGMNCHMIRTLQGVNVMERTEDCVLLQEYSRSSLHRNAAQCFMPLKTIVFNFLIILFLRN